MADLPYKLYKLKFDTVIVGSGAAGFNAANRLYENDIRDIAIITEDINAGTSRNSGSDKQTYYKLSLESSESDSIYNMAKVYLDGLQMHGDLAKVEASESVRSFMNLVELGVEFPQNEYGEFIGYKTDHDPNKRATSSGPYTSRYMTEKLQKRASDYNIRILNHHKAIKIFTKDGGVSAILTINKEDFYLIYINNLIYATGGPATLYSKKVYPPGQKGSSGIAFEAGVKGANLTHFQYGIASINPRWNVSGTYMQSIPRFYSIDDDGIKHYFLEDYYSDQKEMMKNVFLKGYQWPFDVKKIFGSSMIDYLVDKEEVENNRKVFLDFRENPYDSEIEFDALDSEVRDYLYNNDAFLDKPIDRLIKMNNKAYLFYIDHGVDLKKEALQISVCAQHNNGGLNVDINYQTNIEGFYAVGEVAGSHGIYRPGGSALNAGQVGSKRASENIALTQRKSKETDLSEDAMSFINKFENIILETSNVIEIINKCRKEMSDSAGAFRNVPKIRKLIDDRKNLYEHFFDIVKIKSNQIIKAFELYDLVLCQLVYLEAMVDYYENNDSLVGGSFYYNDMIDISKENKTFKNQIQISEFKGRSTTFIWQNPREIPTDSLSFEKEWNNYIRRRENL